MVKRECVDLDLSVKIKIIQKWTSALRKKMLHQHLELLILNSDLSCCLSISSAWTSTTMATPANVNFS